jgi:hypothetical protein
MKTKRMLLLVGVVATFVLSAPRVSAIVSRPLVVIDPAGTVRIQQGLPCGDDLDITRRIVSGRIDVTKSTIPSTAGPVQVMFNLTRMELFLEPFSVQRKCRGIDATAEFYEIGLRLAAGVVFPAEEVGPPESGKYRFLIGKNEFLIEENIFDNAPVPQPERAYQKPSEDVTGLIDLREGTIEIHIALTSRMHFRAGCSGKGCVIDEEHTGGQTAAVLGRISPPNADGDHDGVPDVIDTCPGTANPTQAPDTTPPTAACTAGRGNTFQVSAVDACSSRVALQLGPYTIGNGEVIKIEETGKPGVRLLSGGPNGIRSFQVGKGQAIVMATDAAGNTANAACR